MQEIEKYAVYVNQHKEETFDTYIAALLLYRKFIKEFPDYEVKIIAMQPHTYEKTGITRFIPAYTLKFYPGH